jgi:HD-GYP domain-containing protein (c-di-GMP phosphodiesterase class II)
VLRLLGLLGGLSLATDLGAGAPLDESLQRCWVAARLARAVGCTGAEVSDVVYTSLLQHLGCTAYAHEAAGTWGDDVTSVRLAFLTDTDAPSDVWRTWVSGLARSTGRSRARVLANTAVSGRQVDAVAPVATCEVARDASRRLGLPPSVQESLFHAVSRWDGRGYPPAAGPAIPRSTRIMHVASTAVLFALHADAAEACAQLRRRAGRHLDPELVEAFLDDAAALLAGLHDVDAYAAVLAAEPDPVRHVTDLDGVAATFGDLVDLKSPWLHGHSGGVARLAAAATERLGLAADVPVVRVAGHLHDLGRVGISSRIWDKPGPLSQSERDQARLHAHHSERILARVPALARVATLAGQHHERCDGSGYHRGATAAQLPMPSRVLAAADAFDTLVGGRPHHAAVPGGQAADRLRVDVRSGRLDGDAVAAVLHASGLPAGLRGGRGRPAGLTHRQVEVLQLLAAGLSNRDIANRLVISPRTAEHHVQDVYARLGVSTRAGAALLAMEHGLLGTGRDEPGAEPG